jgi:uncharacterized SAM-dependent methyltransferase
MAATVSVAVHVSLFPENVREGLLRGLRSREIPPRFHYESYKQAQKWLALHERYSPARVDPDCARIYEESFAAAALGLAEARAHLIGLGCGGGQKEARLLRALGEKGKQIFYTPCDASLALVLAAWREAGQASPRTPCRPLLCDLGAADDLAEVFEGQEPGGSLRLLTLFGLIPNFEPDALMPKVAALVRPGDVLLFSANLAPGSDYAAGVKRVLPGYDNTETRDWLLTLLYDLGVEPRDGEARVWIEETPPGLRRIVADFHFARDRALLVEGEHFDFRAGETVRLFFSYRYTAERVVRLLQSYQFEVTGEWITQSGEEGVFQCRKKAD